MFLKVNIKELFPNKMDDNSKVTKIFFLIPKNGFQTRRISKSELINNLVFNMKIEYPPFYRYILTYSYMFPNTNPGYSTRGTTAGLMKNIDDDIPVYRVEVPENYDEVVLKKICNVID